MDDELLTYTGLCCRKYNLHGEIVQEVYGVREAHPT